MEAGRRSHTPRALGSRENDNQQRRKKTKKNATRECRVSVNCLGVLGLDGTADKTGTTSGDQTDLLTGGGEARTRRGLADVLVVTTTVRVVNRVHSHTTSARPRVPLDLELVVSATCLEQGLVDTSTTGNNTDRSTRRRRNRLLGTRRQTNTRRLAVRVVTDDGGVVTRRTRKRATVTGLLFDVAHNRTFRQRREREHVGNVERRLLTAVHELAGGETLGSDKSLDTGAVLVGVAEGHLGKRSTTVE